MPREFYMVGYKIYVYDYIKYLTSRYNIPRRDVTQLTIHSHVQGPRGGVDKDFLDDYARDYFRRMK